MKDFVCHNEDFEFYSEMKMKDVELMSKLICLSLLLLL